MNHGYGVAIEITSFKICRVSIWFLKVSPDTQEIHAIMISNLIIVVLAVHIHTIYVYIYIP